jgi:hypothetical protein
LSNGSDGNVGKDRSTTTLLLPSLNEPTEKIMALPYSSYISAVFGSRGSQFLMTRRAPGVDSMLGGVVGRPTSPRPQLRRTERSPGPRHDRHGSSIGSDSHFDGEHCARNAPRLKLYYYYTYPMAKAMFALLRRQTEKYC